MAGRSAPTPERPRRVLHVVASDFYGGPEKQILEHLKLADRDAITGIVASFVEPGAACELLVRARAAGLGAFEIRSRGPLDWRAVRALGRTLEVSRADLLCTHGYKAAFLGWWVARRRGIPLIVFSRGYTTENRRVAVYEWLERRALRAADGVVCVSHAQRERLRDEFGVENPATWVVHNAVIASASPPAAPASGECEEFRAQMDLPPKAVVALAAGRLSPEKGHRVLLDAVAALGPAAAGLGFLICGEGGERRELERQAERLGITHLCRFLGFRRDMPWLYRHMDFLVNPSLTEGLPNVVLESFSWCKPVVATAVGGVPEAVEHGVSGVLVPRGDAEALAAGIRRLAASAALRTAMGEAGFATVRDRFSFRAQYGELLSVYEAVLGAAASARWRSAV